MLIPVARRFFAKGFIKKPCVRNLRFVGPRYAEGNGKASEPHELYRKHKELLVEWGPSYVGFALVCAFGPVFFYYFVKSDWVKTRQMVWYDNAKVSFHYPMPIRDED